MDKEAERELKINPQLARTLELIAGWQDSDGLCSSEALSKRLGWEDFIVERLLNWLQDHGAIQTSQVCVKFLKIAVVTEQGKELRLALLSK